MQHTIARVKPERRAWRIILRADGYWVEGPTGQSAGPVKSPQAARVVACTLNREVANG